MRDPNRPRVTPKQRPVEPVADKQPTDVTSEAPPDNRVPFTKPDGTVIYGTPKQVAHWNKMKRGIRRRIE